MRIKHITGYILIAGLLNCLNADRVDMDLSKTESIGSFAGVVLEMLNQSSVPSYMVNGSINITGLAGTLELTLNSKEKFNLIGNGKFSFSTPVLDGSTYNLTAIQRATFAVQSDKQSWITQTCNFSPGSVNSTSAVVAGGDTNISLSVVCTDNPYVKDSSTGKMWMRCSQGQSWDSVKKTCGGAALINLQYCSANDNTCNDLLPAGEVYGTGVSGHLNGKGVSSAWSTCNALNAGAGTYGSTAWRVPWITELKSLRYCSNGTDININANCGAAYTQPTIDTVLFPNTAVNIYWSASAFDLTQAYYVRFSDGSIDIKGGKITTIMSVRCVAGP